MSRWMLQLPSCPFAVLQVVATGTMGAPLRLRGRDYIFNMGAGVPKSVHLAEINPVITL